MIRRRPETVLGHTLPEPRITLAGVLTLLAWVSLPVLILGSLLDALMQGVFGVCVGLWCAL